jgi:hypothetical protein
MGSTALARRAGNQQAMNATSTSAAERIKNVIGSLALIQ